MSDNIVLDTAVETIKNMAPAIIAAATASNPQAAVFAPLAMNIMQAAIQLSKAGVMTEQQLISMFAQNGNNLQSVHAQWIAMNTPDYHPV